MIEEEEGRFLVGFSNKGSRIIVNIVLGSNEEEMRRFGGLGEVRVYMAHSQREENDRYEVN